MLFADSLTQTQRGASGPGGGTGGSNAAQIGLGTQLGSIDNLMTSGALQSTGNPYDVAIQQGLLTWIFAPGLALAILITAMSFINFGVDLLSNPHLRED